MIEALHYGVSTRIYTAVNYHNICHWVTINASKKAVKKTRIIKSIMENMSKKKILVLLIFFLFLVLSVLFICPDNKSMLSDFHSSQLKQMITKEGNTIRTDYIDDSGIIRVAADAGYASKVVIELDIGTIEKFLDDKGELIKRYYGYYGILREYDENGNNIRVTYLDIEGNPLNTGMGYAIEERAFNEKKQITAVRYKNATGAPALTSLYGYGIIYDYDENGLNYKITYIDANGEPMMTNQGYSSVIRQYYSSDGPDNGRVKNEFYFDEHGEPVALSMGHYGLHKEYNERGQEILLSYLDAEGNPIVTNKGYTTIARTYKADNNVATEQYYDLKGEPFSLSEGQYGIKNENGQTVYLNQYGKDTFNLRNLLYNKSRIVIPFVIILIIIPSFVDKKWNTILLVLYTGAIVYMTLMFRDGNEKKKIELLWYYRKIFADSMARADIIKNIWLFIPLGAILYQIKTKKMVLIIPIILSAAIEGIQYFSGVGFCELDDIISNSVGGSIGFIAEKLTTDSIRRIKSWRQNHIL